MTELSNCPRIARASLSTIRNKGSQIMFIIILTMLLHPSPSVSFAKVASQRRRVQHTEPYPSLWTYNVVAEYPHDPKAFTQGLQFDRACDDDNRTCFDVLWESTGLNGRSSMRQVELVTGVVRQQLYFPYENFGEGSTRLGDHLYMLKWRTGRAFKMSLDMKQVQDIDTGLGDGWGLTTDGTHLIASESSQVIHWLDPTTLQEVKQITVTDRGHHIRWLNELEVVGDELWGNVWQTECIARVNMSTGVVTGWIQLHGLREGIIRQGLGHGNEMDVLNGIAYEPATQRIFVTGKLWPRVYEIRVVPFLVGQAPPWAAVERLCWPPIHMF